MGLSRTFASGAGALAIAAAALQANAATLGTPVQIEKDALAVRLLASPPVRKEVEALEAFYAQDPQARNPAGKVALKAAAESMAMSVMEQAVNADPDRPAVTWATAAAHRWGDIAVPRAGIVQDNPDNVYRGIPIDGAASYVITGHVKEPRPAQVSFVLHAMMSGAVANQQVKHNESEAAALMLDQLQIDPNGDFTITVDANPANGRPNHLQSQPDEHHEYILIRDTLSDWATQNPVELSVKRVAGPPIKPAPIEAELADRAAQMIANIGSYWLRWEDQVYFSKPANIIQPPWARVSGWGYSAFGWYDLADDEALVVTLDREGAKYMDMQTADLWGPARDYVDRNGAFNQSQAKPNPDGTYTLVLSVRDPGVYNWLDPSGLSAGTLCLRWQALPKGASAADAVKSVKVVKLADLKANLPAGTIWVTPAERHAQLVERAASYAHRINN